MKLGYEMKSGDDGLTPQQRWRRSEKGQRWLAKYVPEYNRAYRRSAHGRKVLNEAKARWVRTAMGRVVNRAKSKRARDRRRMRLLEKYSDGTFTCACCGISGTAALPYLELDHIPGNGRDWIRAQGGWQNHMRWLDSFFNPNIRVLCTGCNAMVQPYAERCPLHGGPL